MRRILSLHVPKRILGILLIGVVLIFATMLGELGTITQITQESYEQEVSTMALYRAYANTDIEADTAIVYDATNQTVLYGKHPEKRVPLASITKIMTALVARTILPSQSPIRIEKSSRTDEPDLALRLGDTWQMKDLTQYFLVKSSNDGSQAVCDAVTTQVKKSNPTETCITLMNRYAKNQGLNSLYFANPSGLDLASGAPSNFGSAYDVARLLNSAYVSYPSLFAATSEPVVRFNTGNYQYEAVNTDKVLEEIGTVLAGKTGYTDTAGGNLVVLYEPQKNWHVVIVVLGASREGRFSDMLELVRRTNLYTRIKP